MDDKNTISIKLDEFKTDFFNQMKEIWEEKRYSDVTIIVGEEKFQCHRLILSLASNYFKKLFSGDFKEKNADEVILHDISVHAFKTILNAIYTGELKFKSHWNANLYEILKLSSILNVKAVENACVSHLLDQKCRDICYIIEICTLADTIGQLELYNVCSNVIASDLLHYCKVYAFRNLTFDNLKSILSRVRFLNDVEYDQNDDESAAAIVKAIMYWNMFNKVSTEDLEVLLKSANFNEIDSAEMAITLQSVFDNLPDEENEKNEELKVSDESLPFESRVFTLYAAVTAMGVKHGIKETAVFKLNKEKTEWILCSSKPTRYATPDYTFERIHFKGKSYLFTYSEEKNNNCFIRSTNLTSPHDVFREWMSNPPILLKNFHVLTEENLNKIYFFCSNPTNGWMQIFEYHCTLDLWSSISIPDDMKINKRCPIAIQQSKMFIFGMEKLYGTETGSKYVACMNCNNTSGFSIISKMPFSHDGAALCSRDSKIYLCGSSYDESSSRSLSVFDIQTNEFQSLKQMNVGRAKTHQMLYLDEFLYVFDNQPFKEPEKYNIALNQWSSVPSIPQLVSHNNRYLSTGKFLKATIGKHNDQSILDNQWI